ncbi:MAG: LytR C-terminal domain-containing protein [Chlorobi bacterium]|nr:MAG: hypothetical protein UZ07_CHB004003081 [Chlorobi bacterium OLB7]MBK8912689.1 LytR C-terminal domain-containing protein [Chlorobiota bacterium]MBX7216433.1 LytR C-terminal domain-containing protein [Candidatus Kapabacteria bacterium]
MNQQAPRRLRDRTAPPAASSTPGRRKGRYLLAIVPATLLVLVLGYALLERNVIRPKVDSQVERTDMYVKAGEHIQVNVVNACGVNGVAVKFTEFLRARKFDVPEYGTEKTLERYSKVIDRIGDPVSARKIAYALGIPPERIETEIDSSLYLRATVIIGEDYLSLRPMK